MAATLIVPVFLYRHYVTDKGVFPAGMLTELQQGRSAVGRQAGILPYVALAVGVAIVLVAALTFR